MSNNQTLKAILKQQELDEESQEYKKMMSKGQEIVDLLKEKFDEDSPVISFAGSQAKGTMVKSKYDLDITCYFTSGANEAGANLKELFEAVKSALSSVYAIEMKNSAIGVFSFEDSHYLHVDVVPGRFVDGNSGDVFLHVEKWDEHWLKTNLQTHVDHVKNSGCLDEIKLMKIWNVRHGSPLKTFILELLVIKLLKEKSDDKTILSENMKFLFEEMLARIETIQVEDPANSGNDLSLHFDGTTRLNTKLRLEGTIDLLNKEDWEGVFVPLEKSDDASIRRVAATISMKPHYNGF